MKKREAQPLRLKARSRADEADLRADLSDRNDLTLAEPPSTDAPPAQQPCCVTLLLRAHAEQGFLRREVLPVLSQLEEPGELDCSERSAALAFLEVAWLEAQLRAFATDLTRATVIGAERAPSDRLQRPAELYYRSLRALRAHVGERARQALALARASA